MENNDAKNYPEPIAPTKEEALNVLAGKSRPEREHANFLNQRAGLPLITHEEARNAEPSSMIYFIIQLERYAKEMGWLEDRGS